MALDESKRSDTVFMEQSIIFAIDKDLLEEVKPIRIDYVEAGGQSGFLLTPGDQLPSMSVIRDFNALRNEPSEADFKKGLNGKETQLF